MKIEPPLSDRTSIEPIFTFNANVADKSTGRSARGIVSGLSLDGCLFQSPHLFSIGTILRLEFILSGHRVEVSAIVRQASPANSLSLEFFALDSAESLQTLQAWLAKNCIPLPSKT
jgi:PilZ domain-containing protein